MQSKIINIVRNYFGEGLSFKEAEAKANTKGTKENSAYNLILEIYQTEADLSRSKQPSEEENLPRFKKLNSLDELAGRNVLIKPNLVSAEEYPETSDLGLLNRIIDELMGKAGYIAVGDGPSLFFDSSKPIERARKQINADVYDFNKSQYVRCYSPSLKTLKAVEIPEEIFDFDFLINLANLKDHNSFGYSGAQKNMMGAVSPATRLMIHHLNEEDKRTAIEELSNLFMPQITIMDARMIMGFAQQKEYGGVPRRGPGVLSHSNPKYLDIVARYHL